MYTIKASTIKRRDAHTMNNSLKKTKLVLLILFALFFTTSAGWAATYYVDSSQGNNNNNGTSQSAPWRTISKVNAGAFRAGDTILFKRGGVWYETLIVKWSGQSGNPITFGAYGSGNLPLIDGQKTRETVLCKGNSYVNFDSIEVRNSTTNGFYLVGDTRSGYALHINFTNCIASRCSHHGFKCGQDVGSSDVTTRYITYENCLSYSNSNIGYQASNGTGNITFRGCIARDNAKNGFRFGSTAGGLMEYCESYNHMDPTYGVGVAIQTSNNAPPCSDIVLRKNRIRNNECGAYIDSGGNHEVYYNLFYSNTRGVSYRSTSGKFFNNTFSNSSQDVSFSSAVQNVEFRNNIYRSLSNSSSGFTSSNNYSGSSPGFVNPYAGDYSLQRTSPCIDAGRYVGLASDINDASVPAGSTVDIGAYEYGGTVSVQLSAPRNLKIIY
ncbi:MAG: right-handed parallel beta-helix repeat-containing protein [Syntrophales bacterium]|nr:right-handed parallel beta-helix repeat-containing protein [Syntrophales bacterium]MDY0044711.1 right-handed parallel beta-helix repeat-containing protein [Syntrophales bacterium]